MQNLKRIPLRHMYNCRDLGGYGCENGGMVAYHRFLRSDCPAGLDRDEWETLYEYGVRTVIDLRSKGEIRMVPYETIEGIEKISYPMQKEIATAEQMMPTEEMSLEEIAKAAGEGFGKSLTEGYIKMLEEAPERVAAILNLIGEKLKNGGVLFHCTAGKDRTGVTAALIYLLCGVRQEDIIADYQITETYQAMNPMFDSVPEQIRHLLNSNPENMREFLQNAREKNYLRLLYEYGLRPEAVSNIKKSAFET